MTGRLRRSGEKNKKNIRVASSGGSFTKKQGAASTKSFYSLLVCWLRTIQSYSDHTAGAAQQRHRLVTAGNLKNWSQLTSELNDKKSGSSSSERNQKSGENRKRK